MDWSRVSTTVTSSLIAAAIIALGTLILSLIDTSIIIGGLGGVTQEEFDERIGSLNQSFEELGIMYGFNTFPANGGDASFSVDVPFTSIIEIVAYVAADADERDNGLRAFMFADIFIDDLLCSKSGSHYTSTPGGRDFEIINTCVMRVEPTGDDTKIAVKLDTRGERVTLPSGNISYKLFRDP